MSGKKKILYDIITDTNFELQKRSIHHTREYFRQCLQDIKTQEDLFKFLPKINEELRIYHWLTKKKIQKCIFHWTMFEEMALCLRKAFKNVKTQIQEQKCKVLVKRIRILLRPLPQIKLKGKFRDLVFIITRLKNKKHQYRLLKIKISKMLNRRYHKLRPLLYNLQFVVP